MDPRIVDLINKIAESLGMQAARLWPQLVWLTWIKGIIVSTIEITVLVACIVAATFTIKVAIKANAADAQLSTTDADASIFLAVIVTFATVLIGLVVVLDLPTSLGAVFAPEATTVLKLLTGKYGG